MKKIYEKPTMQLEEFTANEYCVDCSTDPDHQYITYYFNCNAGVKSNSFKYIVRDASGNQHNISGWPRYQPCGEEHEISVKRGTPISSLTDILTGYHIDRDDTKYIDENIPVIIWTDGGTQVHCTTDMNTNEWSTAKS